MNLKSLSSGRTDLLSINPAIITVDPSYNVRKFDPVNDEDDKGLIESIRHNGVRTPLTIRLVQNEVVVVAGHRRLAAVKLLLDAGVEIKTLPCMPELRNTSDADRDLDLITSNSGKPLTGIEKSMVYARLAKYGWSEEQIAKRVGVSSQHVRDMLTLHVVPEPIKEMIEAGAVSASLAVKTVRSEGEDATEVLEKAVTTAKADGKAKVTPKELAKVESTKAAAKKAASTNPKPVAKEPEPSIPGVTAIVSPVTTDAKSDALTALDLMVKSLEKMEVDTRINARARLAIEKARIAVGDAFDITDQN